METDVLFRVGNELTQYIEENSILRRIVKYVHDVMNNDMAHDFSHIARVLSNAWEIAQCEGGDLEIIVAAVLLHDIRNLPKDHAKAKSSSSLSARFARQYLEELGFPQKKIGNVENAIVCHSFSKGLFPKTLEGKILQDADRLDALGAIGIARLFQISGIHSASIYCPVDPFYREERSLDDRKFAVDHFYRKLLKLPNLMQTETGKVLARRRAEVLLQYLDVLEREIDPSMEQFLRTLT